MFDGPKWFCVVVNPNCLRRAEYFLGAAGYRTFCLKLRKWVSHARVKRAVERPLLRDIAVQPSRKNATLNRNTLKTIFS